MKTRRFGQPKHQIHVLHGLPRCPFHQVIFSRDYDRRMRLGIVAHRYLAAIRAAHIACCGKLALGKHFDEGLAGKARFINQLQAVVRRLDPGFKGA